MCISCEGDKWPNGVLKPRPGEMLSISGESDKLMPEDIKAINKFILMGRHYAEMKKQIKELENK